MIWIVSWRNVWRNKLRSAVIILSVSLGVFAGVFTLAFYNGMGIQRINSAIRTEVSHIQIHTESYMEKGEIGSFLHSTDSIIETLSAINEVKSISTRVIANAIINSAEKGGGIRLVGIDPGMESQVTDISMRLVEGNYLEKPVKGSPVILGKKLAEKLGVKTGSKLVVGLLDISGQPVYQQFRVSGIFRTASNAFDEVNVFVPSGDVRQMAGMPENSAHEIVLLVSANELAEKVSLQLKSIHPGLNIKNWKEAMPELEYLEESLNYYMYIFIIIILLALGFGIVNTMLMVVLERVRELGMLMAVGMNKRRIFSMIMLETIFLSLTGGIAGVIAGTVVCEVYKNHGIDLSGLYGEGFAELGYDSVIYTVIHPDMIAGITALVLLTGIISSVFPARKALELNPSEAIRTDV